MTTRRIAGTAILATLVAPWLVRRAAAQPGERSALDLIDATRGVSLFAQIIRNHKLEESFKTGRHGYFVPTNEAIERLPALRLEGLRNDAEAARQLVLNHVTDFTGVISTFGNEWNESVNVQTLAGRRYTLTVAAYRQPRLNDIPVLYMNYRVANGYCHAIDGVLWT